jgi:lambda family phage tail tape measure protein
MAKISGIYVEIRGDASQLKKELKEAREAVTNQAQGMSNALNNALSPAQLKNSINGLVRELNTLSNASKLTGKEFGLIGADLKGMSRLVGVSEKDFASLQSRMMQTSAAKAQESALRSVAKAAGLSAVEVQALGRQMNLSSASVAAVAGAGAKASSSMISLGSAASAAMAYLSVSSVMQFSRAVLDAGIAMDSLQRSFVAIAGSQYGAAEEIEFLRSEADRLGQSFFDLAPAYKNFTAAAKGTALEGEQSRKIFSAMIEASTALGISTADTEGALRALTQAMSKGKIMSEEWRGQLAERLPGAFQKLADSMGVSQGELNKLLEQGKVLTHEVLPGFGAAIHAAYGEAARTAALESGQAAVNRLSGAWTDLKVNLYDSDSAVAGINKVTEAIKTLTEWANLRSVSATFAQGAKLASEGKFDYQQFVQASFLDRQKMVDRGGTLNKFRGKVDRNAVAPAYSAIAPTASISAIDTKAAKAAANAAEKAHEKMLADGRKAAEALEKYWNDYEDSRVKAIADGVAERAKAQEKDFQLITEFADKYKAVILGETEFKKAQIQAQADAYRRAGADEVAVAQWAAAEKLKFSRDWQDGAVRALQAYTDNASNAALATESVMNTAFKGMEDMVANFVKTGKLEFADLVTSINAEIARLAFRGMAQESYDWLGGLMKTGLSMAGSYFGGGFNAGGAMGTSTGTGGGFNMGGGRVTGLHSGGIVGSESTFTREINPLLFAGAKRFHTGGIAGDEVPIIAKRGEGVFTEGQMKALGGGSNSEATALLRELVAATRAQKAQKNVFAFDKRTVANELSGSEGEQMTLTHVRRNPAAVRRMLGLG